MGSQEKYLRPEVIRQVKRLDLRAKFIVEGFLSGLHASPFQGFSAEFSEHRKYEPGDDINQIDWQVYARTDRYYIKKFEAETNLNGYLVMDLSSSMNFTYGQELTKFEYGICCAAALAYMMIHQSDPVGLITFDTKIRHSLPPKSRKTQLATLLALLSRLTPNGETKIAASIQQLASMLKHKSLVMIFSDFFDDPESIGRSLHALRHRGHDIICFHILDASEVEFPFKGMVEFIDVESPARLTVDADGMKADYLEMIGEFQANLKKECQACGADYLAIHTGQQFDKALTRFLVERAKK